MLEIILERLFWVIFILSTLNIIRHGYYSIQSIINSADGSTPADKYRLSFRSLLLLGLSMGYFIMSLIKGINL
jgi:hypothetical protein